MKTITTRDLLHRTKKVRAALEMGESVAWTSHGKIVAYLQAPRPQASPDQKRDWIARARAAGAVNQGQHTVASSIYDDRD